LCQRKKFSNHVDGISDPKIIAEHIAAHFSKVCSSNSAAGKARLKEKYEQMRFSYCGQLTNESYQLETELVKSVIANMKRGKAAGLWMG